MSLGCSSLYLLAAWGCLVSATVLCEFVKVSAQDALGDTITISRGIWKGDSIGDGSCGSLSSIYRDPKASQEKICDSFFSSRSKAHPLIYSFCFGSGKQLRPFPSLDVL